MTKLLYVNSSPRGEQSETRALADAFLSAYIERAPEVEVDHLDLWTDQLPVYGGRGVDAKMAVFGGQTPAGEAGDAWAEVRVLAERFTSADEYLFTVPMWNHTVPWVLKHFIDTISQPGMVFGFDPETGYEGLVKGKRAVAVYSSAVYWESAPLAFGRDFHRAYFNDWLRWIGIEDVAEIRFQPNLVTADAEGGRRRAIADARSIAERYAGVASYA